MATPSVVRVAAKPQFDRDAFLAATFLMFARASRDLNPDVDGMFELGEIGEAREKSFERLTGYSWASPVR